MPKDDVVASLAVYFISESREGSHGASAGERGEFAQADTSTNSSEIGGGMGSPCASRLSRYAPIAP